MLYKEINFPRLVLFLPLLLRDWYKTCLVSAPAVTRLLQNLFGFCPSCYAIVTKLVLFLSQLLRDWYKTCFVSAPAVTRLVRTCVVSAPAVTQLIQNLCCFCPSCYAIGGRAPPLDLSLKERQFYIISEMHCKVLDINGGSPVSGTKLIMWPRKPGPPASEPTLVL